MGKPGGWILPFDHAWGVTSRWSALGCSEWEAFCLFSQRLFNQCEDEESLISRQLQPHEPDRSINANITPSPYVPLPPGEGNRRPYPDTPLLRYVYLRALRAFLQKTTNSSHLATNLRFKRCLQSLSCQNRVGNPP